jgi:parallel beta-helix repeat protein
LQVQQTSPDNQRWLKFGAGLLPSDLKHLTGVQIMKYLSPTGISSESSAFWKHFNADYLRAFGVAALLAGTCQPAATATLFVNPGGTSGAYSTIGAAVNNASANDTIDVAPGTYFEDVTIGKPLSLVGAGRGRSIINAVGQSNGIYIDGLDNPGLSRVVVTGFTIENANFEGILVTNASFVTIWENDVINNDKSLNISGPAIKCPGIPSFETAEDFDCGEGIHLSGVDHSVVGNNTAKHNAGGILLSDDTGTTHHNLIIGNVTQENPFDCGITIASHPPAMVTKSTSPLGVFHNTIANNESSRNGFQVPGAGAGVGIFDSAPGTQAYSNVVINNALTDNGLPGVALHSHTANQNLNDNVITRNRISGNGADTDDAATPGPTGINIFGVSPITGTVISENVIDDEAVDIVTKTPAQVAVHLNDLLDGKIGVDNIGAGTVDATENWWGCPGGPGEEECTTVSGPGISYTPWLIHPIHEERK